MSDANSGLIDILEPAAPAAVETVSWILIAGIVAALVAFAVALFLIWKYKLPSYQALKRLRKLQKELHAGEHTPHESILMLALELRHGLAVKRLLANKAPESFSQQDHERWLAFMQQLDAVLYQHHAAPEAEKISAIFAQTEYWLRHYARRSTLMKIEI